MKNWPPASWTPPKPEDRKGPAQSFDIGKADEDCTPSELDAKAHRAASVRENPELWTAVAEFAGEYSLEQWKNIESLASFLSTATFLDVTDVRDWLAEVQQNYPTGSLPKGRSRRTVREGPARAFYLLAALTKLLALADAPPQLAIDLERLLSEWMPKRSLQRVRIQTELYRNPEASLQKIATAAGCTKGKVSRDLAAGRVIRPPLPG